jgi:hypothetical protein
MSPLLVAHRIAVLIDARRQHQLAVERPGLERHVGGAQGERERKGRGRHLLHGDQRAARGRVVRDAAGHQEQDPFRFLLGERR